MGITRPRAPVCAALFIALLLAPWAAKAQDERRVVSPNGEFEFHVFVGQPKDGLWPRIGYQVAFRGKPLIATSWMGLDIRDQQPLLGENAGLVSSETASNKGSRFNSLVAHYMQNGSLGRRLDIEIRAYDDAVAFRYIIPRSTPLKELFIQDEATEFNFPQGAVSHLPAKSDYNLPFAWKEPGAAWIVITSAGPELAHGKYPRTDLIRSDEGLLTNLARSAEDSSVAFAGTTPSVWLWRVVLAGADKERLMQSETLSDLNR
ncbi:MAG: glycoside hydrolase family 97 N-terminal domain-containing protein [Bryobacteraceae bacterium]